jgi:hypothetical protein
LTIAREDALATDAEVGNTTVGPTPRRRNDALVIGALSHVRSPGSEKTVSVSDSTRTFILGPDDIPCRFQREVLPMVDDPESDRLERFAGQRMSMAEAIVEVHDRAPCAVVRLVYQMLGFDAKRRLDRATFIRQNTALAELAIDPVMPRLVATEAAVVDAGSRFVARGESWHPSAALEQEILRAALDQTPCKRL